METQLKLFEPLIKHLELYGKQSIELVRLKTIDKTANLFSTLFAKVLLFSSLLLGLVILSIGGAVFLGDFIGNMAFGFVIVAAFYLIIGLILLLIQPTLKSSFYNSLIEKLNH